MRRVGSYIFLVAPRSQITLVSHQVVALFSQMCSTLSFDEYARVLQETVREISQPDCPLGDFRMLASVASSLLVDPPRSTLLRIVLYRTADWLQIRCISRRSLPPDAWRYSLNVVPLLLRPHCSKVCFNSSRNAALTGCVLSLTLS